MSEKIAVLIGTVAIGTAIGEAFDFTVVGALAGVLAAVVLWRNDSRRTP